MKLGILAVGHKLPGWVAAGYEEYIDAAARATGGLREHPARAARRQVARTVARRRMRALQAALQGFRRIVVLDERGLDLTTLKLAERLEEWMREGGDTAFVIGGADGIDAALKQRADVMIRLSSLTLPHAMARLVLCEQLYRAVSVVRNHPYHREG